MTSSDPIISNLFALFRALEKESDSVSIIDFGQGLHAIQSENSDWPNFVFSTTNSNENPKMHKTASDRKLHAKTLLLVDEIDESNVESLAEQGYLHAARWHKFSIDQSSPDNESIENPKIEKVTSQADLKTWICIAQEGYGLLNEAMFHSIQKLPECDLYLARLDEKPIGTFMTFINEGVGGVYFLYVQDALRLKGIGYSLSRYSLNHLLHNPEINAVIGQAREATWPIIEKLNGKHAGYIDVFWPPAVLQHAST